MLFICLPRLELSNFLMAPSSFLSDLDRLALPHWVPTDYDILYARVRTVGVATHHYSISVRNKTRSWHLFDVGGTRGQVSSLKHRPQSIAHQHRGLCWSQRKAWLPFFEGTTAVIFLAPVSVFDEFLDEAPETNRMDDCMQLFSNISSSPLLRITHIVLFLNKSDILRRKLLHGIKITDLLVLVSCVFRSAILKPHHLNSINTFAPRENEISVALQFFRDHFSEIFFRTNKVNDRRQARFFNTSQDPATVLTCIFSSTLFV
jgi:guanine nucleotide-binding protein alpha-1 subunit